MSVPIPGVVGTEYLYSAGHDSDCHPSQSEVTVTCLAYDGDRGVSGYTVNTTDPRGGMVCSE